MKTEKIKIIFRLLILAVGFLIITCGNFNSSYAQQIRWLRITPLQTPVNEIGGEFEGEFTAGNSNIFSWPAQYSIDQNTLRMRGLWIGCRNFNDPVAGKVLSYKVIDAGPRVGTYSTKIFPQVIKLIGKRTHPIVTVDDQLASVLNSFDILDEVNLNLECDREVLVKFNTSMGISVTKKQMVFDQPNNDNYHIKDFVFTNTGIYDAAGDVIQQTLDSVYFYFTDRYSFAGVSCTGYGLGWGSWNSTWGESNTNHSVGGDPTAPEYTDPSKPTYQLRAAYTWYGPDLERTRVSYDDDWGDPDQLETGELAAAKYAGSVTLHADKSATDKSDDIWQPRTNHYISADGAIMNKDVSQYDEQIMSVRWAAITDGHPDAAHQHDVLVGNNYAANWKDPVRNLGGGIQPEMAYGPYHLAPGDSIHIVMAEAVAGISWEKACEVGSKWLLWWNNSPGKPTLTLPDGTTTTDFDAYKRIWVQTGVDSILKTYHNALNNYNSGYAIPKPPPPPNQFTVTSGGDRIILTWANNAESDPHFGGYVIYRSQGNVLDRRTVYEKIFDCTKSNIVNEFDDVTAKRGFDYYYYIQSKDDGTQAGTALYSSLFWTITSVPATLQRPAEPKTPFPPDVLNTFWKLIVPYKGTWSDTNHYSSHDVVTYNHINYICKLAVFDTTKPDVDTSWQMATTQGDSLAFNKGAWISRSSYADTTHDIVTYNGSSYICRSEFARDTIAPDIDKTHWQLLVSQGNWISGSHYSAGNEVSYLGSNFVTLYAIASGKGLDMVRVVPNPYDIRGRFFQFGDQSQYDRIAFYGLPPICQLKIFTERGDLIWQRAHTKGTGDELWNSTTSSGQIIASGIYILYVETPDGQSVFRKFVVIR